MSSKSFSVESKTFTVESNGNSTKITERRRHYQTFLHFPTVVIGWIGKLFETIHEKEEGFLGRVKEGDMTITGHKKSNGWGKFCTLMFVSPKLRKGPKFIVIPEGYRGTGWNQMKDIGQGSLAVQKQPQHPLVQQQEVNGLQRVVVRQAFQDDVDRLADLGVVITIKEGCCLQEEIPLFLNDIIRLSGVPLISKINQNSFLLKMCSAEDVIKILNLPLMAFRNCKMHITRWRPSSKTIRTSWMKQKTRVIQLHGVPLHLWKAEFITELVKGFGRMSKFEECAAGFEGVSMLKVTVSDCLLIRMPQVIVVLDDSVHYPVRLIPDYDEVFERGCDATINIVEDGGNEVRGSGSYLQAAEIGRWRESCSPSTTQTVSARVREDTPSVSESWRAGRIFRSPSIQSHHLNSEVHLSSIEAVRGSTISQARSQTVVVGQNNHQVRIAQDETRPIIHDNNRGNVDVYPTLQSTEHGETLRLRESLVLADTERNLSQGRQLELTPGCGESLTPMVGGARNEVEGREDVQDLIVQVTHTPAPFSDPLTCATSSGPSPNFAGSEDDGLVSDTGDVSSHCAENL